MSSRNGRKETQSNLSKVTSPGVTRIFKPYSREMAEIGDVFIVKNKITNRLTAKRLPLWTIARECLAANASVSIAPETNTELTIARAVPRARFVRDITPPYAAALVTS